MSNSVPEGWRLKTIGDLVKLQYGKSPKDVMSDDGQYPVIGTGGITGYASSYLFDGCTTVIGRKGTINKPSYVEGKFWAIDTTYFGADYKDTEPKWFYYSLNSFDLTKYNEASGVPSLGRDTLNAIPLSVPPLPEQQKIAAILSSVDDVIEKTRAQIDKLKDLKTGMMQELLTKGIGHTAFKDSPVGRIPEGWEVDCLENISEKISDGIHSTPKYAEKSDYRFVNGNNLKDGYIVYGDSAKYVPLDEYYKHKKALTNGTILMSINGTIGNLAFYRGEEVVLGKSAAYISLNEGQSKEFVYFVLQSQAVKAFYELELTGSTINNLSLRSVKQTPIPLPPKKEQRKIAGILTEIDKGICQRNSKLNKLTSLKKALMQDLLTGKVRVNVDNKENAVA